MEHTKNGCNCEVFDENDCLLVHANEANFDNLKVILGPRLGGMNISNALFITEAQDDFFCFIPQTSEPSMNYWYVFT